jgi:plasmid stability protein
MGGDLMYVPGVEGAPPSRRSNMPSLTIKNLPEELYFKLKKNAEDHHRSLNNEIIVSLEKVVRTVRLNPEELLEEIRELRSKVTAPPLTDDFLKMAKSRGRP